MNDATMERLRTVVVGAVGMRDPLLTLAAAIDRVDVATFKQLSESSFKTELRMMISDLRTCADVVSLLVDVVTKREYQDIVRGA